MALFEAEDIADLLDVFDEVGTTVSVTQQGTSHYDRATSRVVIDTAEQTYDVKAVVEDFNQPQFNGADIQSGDKKFTILEVSLLAPLVVGNIISIGGHDYTIPEKGIKETYDGESIVLYEARGGF